MPRLPLRAARRLGAAILCPLLAALATPAGAQTAPRDSAGRVPRLLTLTGIAWDSLSSAPLAGALVQFVPEREPSAAARTAVADSTGRWRIDSLPAGAYLGGYFHPTLDALGLEPPSFRLLIESDSVARLDLGIPGPARMRELLCGTAAAGDSTGGIVGVLRDSDAEQPLSGATLSVAWRELTIGQGGIRNELRRVPVAAKGGGLYLACGVPTDAPVELDASAPGRASGIVEVQVPRRGMLRRDMLLADSATIVAVRRATETVVDSTNGAAARGLRVAGGATLRGTVTGPDGKPLARAQLAVAGTGRAATTGESGTFVIDSLPDGTHGIEARAVGLQPVRRAVDLMRGRTTTATLALTERVTALSSVVVLGKKSASTQFLEEFTDRRRRSIGGRFLGPAELNARPLIYASDAFRTTPGILVLPARGFGSVVRGRGGCTPAVYLDGTLVHNGADEIDQIITPANVLAMEIYSASTAPPQFAGLSASGCGAIVVWSKR